MFSSSHWIYFVTSFCSKLTSARVERVAISAANAGVCRWEKAGHGNWIEPNTMQLPITSEAFELWTVSITICFIWSKKHGRINMSNETVLNLFEIKMGFPWNFLFILQILYKRKECKHTYAFRRDCSFKKNKNIEWQQCLQ